MADEPPKIDRRPLAARDTRWARALAGQLARRGVPANAISTAGLLAGVSAGFAFASTSWLEGPWLIVMWFVGAVGVILRGLANIADGMVAIETGTASRIGELFNEVPDRVSDAAMLIGLGYAAGGNPTLGYIAAILAILTAYIRAVGKAAGAASFFVGPMAKPQRMFLAVGAAIGSTFLSPGQIDEFRLVQWALAVIAIGSLLTCVRRLGLIANHLRTHGP